MIGISSRRTRSIAATSAGWRSRKDSSSRSAPSWRNSWMTSTRSSASLTAWTIGRLGASEMEGPALPAPLTFRRTIKKGAHGGNMVSPVSLVRRRAYTHPMPDAAALAAFAEQVSACTRCRLAEGRTQVVFGVGDPHAELMFVGEAPGFHEDKQGYPFVGQAGKLLEKLLAGIGLQRSEVYIANVLKCRPPGNRDPQPDEIEACESHLFRQIELIEPTLVATLGNFATKLLSGKPAGITRVHGVEQKVVLGGSRVLLYPIFHPAAALYTPAMLKVLEEDFARLPAILGRPVAQPQPEPQLEAATFAAEPAVQLGLF